MASHSTARLNPRHQDMVRGKIQASQIINRLTQCVLGKVELSAAQVQAARILLDKSVPSLASTELTGVDGGPLEVKIVQFSNPAKQLGAKTVPNALVGRS